MRDEFTSRVSPGLDEVGRVFTHGAIKKNTEGYAEVAEGLQETPGTHPVPIVAPRGIEHIGVRHTRHEVFSHPFAKGVVFDAQREVNGQTGATGPFERRPVRDCGMFVAAMGRHCRFHVEFPIQRCIPTSRAAAFMYISR